MKVICKNRADHRASVWLEEGAIYTVLSIELVNKEIQYRVIETDSSTPALHPAAHFEVLTNHLPSSWIVDVNADTTYLGFAPKAWTKAGFWEEYFDQNHDAISIFWREAKKIIEEESNK